MKILFLTLLNITDLNEHGIYHDLLREFYNHGHQITVVSPVERRENQKTHLISNEYGTFLKVKTGNLQKSNIIEKGISTILLERQFISAIKRFLGNVTFDFIMYSTPPITFAKVVEYLKYRQNARTYLLLKDIFPQNAVDMGMLKKSGVKGLLYRYFRNKEKKLYAISDNIGCMSQANVNYLIQHNPNLTSAKVHICPNSIDIVDMRLPVSLKNEIRDKYGLPKDKRIFVYGGNLGKPQNIRFIIKCLQKAAPINNAFFLIIGDGTDYNLLLEYMNQQKPNHVKLMKKIPKEEYDKMIACCDVGLIFLDHRFTIPNFPSRLLSYMQASLCIAACTDANTDLGEIITNGKFGWWCESADENEFISIVNTICNRQDITAEKNRSYKYLCEHYTTRKCYEEIISTML